MTLIKAIKIIEGLTGKEVTSIMFNNERTKIIYQLDFGTTQEMELN
jgi:hypothetical protein